ACTCRMAAAMLMIAPAACALPAASAAEGPAPAFRNEADCGAARLAGHVGRQASEHVLAALGQWRAGKPMRVIRPGMAVTQDYRPERLNVMLDKDGIIERFTCG
ncbi:MAG: I78 family peptidase inhibitor, partial [Novosphingobium sp.]|nr:I78 family peptidase inhibitor [Novosphingobium sp.]